MIFGLLSAISTVLTFVSILVTIQIPVAKTWLPYLLWGAVAVCLLLLLMLGFIANYTGHVRIVGELTEANQKTIDNLTASHESEIASLKEGHRQITDGLSEQIRSLQEEIAESKRVKLKFEVSTETWESTVCLTDPGDTEDWRDATAFCLDAKLFVRYVNEDAHPIRVHELRLSIRNDATGKEYTLTPGYLMRPVFRAPDGEENHPFVGFMIPGHALTGYYHHQFFYDVPRECALTVDENSYLRVTLDAGKQDPYWVDLDVPWWAARTGHPTVSIRPN